MIFNTGFDAQRNNNYQNTINNLEKAKALLEERYAKKQISDQEYIKRSKDISNQIEKYRNIVNNK